MSYTVKSEVIRRLARAGFETPQDVASVIEATNAAADTDIVIAEQNELLRAALAAGDVQAARSAADSITLAGLPDRVNLYGEIQAHAEQIIDELWPGADAWQFAAKRYNAAADAFTAACGLVNADMPPAALIKASEKVRNAWTAIPSLASELENAADLMLGTAKLHQPDINEYDPLMVLALWVTCASGRTKQLAGAMKDRIQPSRAGRWGHYMKLGAKLTAPATPDAYKPLVVPAPKAPEKVASGWVA